MAPEPVIDAPAGRVRLGDEAHPFEFDCATGRATVGAGGQRWTVRPLRWREKLTLARVAPSGAGFVAEQLLRACLDGAEPPADPGVRAVVAAVASWIDGPADALPLTAPALAAVTLELCRTLGCRPSDLDRLDAPEVEALWRAARREQPAETEYDDGVTRIMVVPDPEPGEASQSAPTPARPAGPRFRVLERAGVDAGAPERAGAGAVSPRDPDAAVPEEVIAGAAAAAAPGHPDALGTTPGLADAKAAGDVGAARGAVVAQVDLGAGRAAPGAVVAPGTAGAGRDPSGAAPPGDVPPIATAPGAGAVQGHVVAAPAVGVPPRAATGAAPTVGAPEHGGTAAGAFGAAAQALIGSARSGSSGLVAPGHGAAGGAWDAASTGHAAAGARGAAPPGSVAAAGAPPLVAAVSSFTDSGTVLARESRDTADDLERDLDAVCERLAVRLEDAVEHAGVLTGA